MTSEGYGIPLKALQAIDSARHQGAVQGRQPGYRRQKKARTKAMLSAAVHLVVGAHPELTVVKLAGEGQGQLALARSADPRG